MQKILILVSLLLYWVGCGESENTVTIKSYRAPDHISIMETSAVFLEGVALDIILSDDRHYAYIASGDAGLNVVDIGDPYNPRVIGTYNTPQYVNHVDIIDGVVYVSYKAQSWSDYIAVSAFDISNPYDVKVLGQYKGFMNNEHKQCTKEGLVYFVDHKGFKVVRESDYDVIGRYDLFDTAYAFSMRDNIAFVANGRNGLTVLKVGESNYRATLTK